MAAKMDPDFARQMFEIGANFVLLGMPKGTEFGIDVNSWSVGEKFKGVKMIPPGIHFIYFSAVNKEGNVAPRTGFFHNFEEHDLLVYHYDPTIEDIYKETNTEQLERIRSNLRNLDQNLGPYPLDSWSKWISLVQHIKPEHIKRLQPISGKICSASELVPNELAPQPCSNTKDKASTSNETDNPSNTSQEIMDGPLPTKRQMPTPYYTSQLPDMKPRPGTELRFTKLPKNPYPDGATAQEMTKGALDSSYSLECVFSRLTSPEEILSELQFAFCCFLVGQLWEGWEQWRLLVITLCRAEECLIKRPKLFLQFLSILYFQVEEVPEDLFLDIVERRNFLAASLTTFFGQVNDNATSLPPDLVSKARRFKRHIMAKFKWNLTLEEDEEDAPVVVELPEASERDDTPFQLPPGARIYPI